MLLDATKIKTIDRDKFDKVLETVKNKKYRCVFLLMYDAGLRPSEAMRLETHDLNFQGRQLNVVTLKKRSDEPIIRSIPMTTRLLEELSKYYQALPKQQQKPHEYLFPSKSDRAKEEFASPKVMWKKFKKKFPNNRPHDCRHSFATNLAEEGVDAITLKELLGHSSSVTTEIYIHIAQERKRKAINLLEPKPDFITRLYRKIFPKREALITNVFKGDVSFIVGRESEMKELTMLCMKRVNVLITGEQGAGKTHLLNNLKIPNQKTFRIDDFSSPKNILIGMLIEVFNDKPELAKATFPSEAQKDLKKYIKSIFKIIIKKSVQSFSEKEFNRLFNEFYEINFIRLKNEFPKDIDKETTNLPTIEKGFSTNYETYFEQIINDYCQPKEEATKKLSKKDIKALTNTSDDYGKRITKESVKNLTEMLVNFTQKLEYTIIIDDVERVTPSGIKTLEKLNRHFHIVAAARKVTISKISFLTNFTRLKLTNLKRHETIEMINRLSYSFIDRIEDYEIFKNHIVEQSNGNPQFIIELIERYEKENAITTEVTRAITHTAAYKEIDMSVPILIFLSSLMILRYLGREVGDSSLQFIGGIFLIIALFARQLMNMGKRKYV